MTKTEDITKKNGVDVIEGVIDFPGLYNAFNLVTTFDLSFLVTFLSNFLNAVQEGIKLVADIFSIIPVIGVSLPAVVVSTLGLCIGIRIVFNLF